MNEFMKTLLSLSISGTLLLLLIRGLKLLYKNKFSRRWQYYIWIIAALRFLLPLTPDTAIIGKLFEKFDTAAITSESPTSPNAPISVNAGDSEAQQVQTNRDIIPATAVHNSLDIYICLFFVWSALALVLFVRKITIYQSFIQYIKAGNTEVSDLKSLNLLSDCEERLNIKTRVELYHNALIASPVMIGFFRPSIVLPAGELKDKDLSYILVHELTHYKQKDMFYKWLIQIVVCVHWFNPFVYLLEKEVNQSCDLSCDERVISVLDDKARREYGDTLISFLKPDNRYKSSLASVTLTEGAKQLKERLGAIMNFRKKSKTVITATAICSAAACACFLATGAYAASPAVNGNKTWKDSEIRNEVLTEDGVYYIFCDGAGENDKPQASVSVGSIQFVLVRKDSYTSIGPFDHSETLMEDVTKQCGYMKSLTQEEKELVIKTAAGIYEENLDSGRQKTISPRIAQYYEADSLPLFEIAFSRLDGKAQREWLEKLYVNGDFAFFSAAVRGLDSDDTLIAEFAEKAYTDGEIAFFSTLADCMDERELDVWLDRALEDGSWNFQSMLFDKLGRYGELDVMEKEWEQQQWAEYQAAGITGDGKNYYYRDELVNIFLDQRFDSSVYTLDINPKGVVNIRVIRDKNNEITGISYMTDEEVTELLGE